MIDGILSMHNNKQSFVCVDACNPSQFFSHVGMVTWIGPVGIKCHAQFKDNTVPQVRLEPGGPFISKQHDSL